MGWARPAPADPYSISSWAPSRGLLYHARTVGTRTPLKINVFAASPRCQPVSSTPAFARPPRTPRRLLPTTLTRPRREDVVLTILQRRRDLHFETSPRRARHPHSSQQRRRALCHEHGARCLCVLWRGDSHRLHGRRLGACLGGELKDVVESSDDLHFLHICKFPPLGLFLPLLHCALLGYHLILSFQSSMSRCVGPGQLHVVVFSQIARTMSRC